MKVQDIYSLSKAWMYEKPSSAIYDNYIIPIMNKVLAEIHGENNMSRMRDGLLPLLEIPEVSSLEDDLDEIGIMPEYQREVIPKGIDSNFLMDDDLYKMSKYDVEYNNARVKYQVLLPAETVEKLIEEAKNAL